MRCRRTKQLLPVPCSTATSAHSISASRLPAVPCSLGPEHGQVVGAARGSASVSCLQQSGQSWKSQAWQAMTTQPLGSGQQQPSHGAALGCAASPSSWPSGQRLATLRAQASRPQSAWSQRRKLRCMAPSAGSRRRRTAPWRSPSSTKHSSACIQMPSCSSSPASGRPDQLSFSKSSLLRMRRRVMLKLPVPLAESGYSQRPL
mmetsp:Transcript_52311/g.144928  ORF Transcript_52311/g.144928 Transcript_52311/m.144928 type:complete len:203 (-) Transcript_52311:238-846(-)